MDCFRHGSLLCLDCLEEAAQKALQLLNQVGDEDAYTATQVSRFEDLAQRHNALANPLKQLEASHSDRIAEVSNDVSMTHDYASGIHHSMVEHGKFLRNGVGLSHDQWVHFNVLERAHLILSRTAGSVEFMRLVHPTFTPIRRKDDA